jgi:hypothetical protein
MHKTDALSRQFSILLQLTVIHANASFRGGNLPGATKMVSLFHYLVTQQLK